MGLVDVPDARRHLGQRRARPRRVQGAEHSAHATETSGSVAEEVEAPPVQLPGVQTQALGHQRHREVGVGHGEDPQTERVHGPGSRALDRPCFELHRRAADHPVGQPADVAARPQVVEAEDLGIAVVGAGGGAEGVVDLLQQDLAEGPGSLQSQAALLELLRESSQSPACGLVDRRGR